MNEAYYQCKIQHRYRNDAGKPWPPWMDWDGAASILHDEEATREGLMRLRNAYREYTNTIEFRMVGTKVEVLA